MPTVLLVNDVESYHHVNVPPEFKERYVIHHAYNGQEALDRIHEGGIDILVTDIQMPEMDGLTLIEKLRKEGYQFPILATSNNDYKRQALGVGANDFIELGLRAKEMIWKGILKISPS